MKIAFIPSFITTKTLAPPKSVGISHNIWKSFCYLSKKHNLSVTYTVAAGTKKVQVNNLASHPLSRTERSMKYSTPHWRQRCPDEEVLAKDAKT